MGRNAVSSCKVLLCPSGATAPPQGTLEDSYSVQGARELRHTPGLISLSFRRGEGGMAMIL